ncbi:uncharacterized protein LOC111350097 isoform X1 [Spodoptera litura]|uniref:Uncharacterized protein LOC111350097 isoform X1 n=1 Tax=Spodoptera litura TaxID=69820 RepID=A0A9J7DU26_SPOLT|nr:uncharacterized protein LOC111350097 isoform X1 [Spodoptera litura]
MKIFCVSVFIIVIVESLHLPLSEEKEGLSKGTVIANMTSQLHPIQVWTNSRNWTTHAPSKVVKNGTNKEIPFVSFLPASKIVESYNEDKSKDVKSILVIGIATLANLSTAPKAAIPQESETSLTGLIRARTYDKGKYIEIVGFSLPPSKVIELYNKTG